jgi:SNF2 family DNA or RNA helicase
MIKPIHALLASLKNEKTTDYTKGETLYHNGSCQVLSHSRQAFDVLITSEDEEETEVSIIGQEEEMAYSVKGKAAKWDATGIAALLQVKEELENTNPQPALQGKAYTREGMMKRVLEERREKAEKANYAMTFADNIYGEHILVNEKGAKFKVTLRDFENETGYINNEDWRTNKLGTTKHIMFAFSKLKGNRKLYKHLNKKYPFVEIYPDPLNEYRITWHYPHELNADISILIEKYFGKKNFIEDGSVKDFLLFIREAAAFSQIVIRPEVEEKVKRAWDMEMLETQKRDAKLDFSLMKVPLFPYQQEGVAFATFRDGAIIADEMGLGKTIQAVATAVMKKQIFGFKRTLIVCPASLKEQWKQEIKKFSNEEAEVVDGLPQQRVSLYQNSTAYFLIVNYETVLRDWHEMNRMETDFVILDEAQKIKNFSTITAQSIKFLTKKHALVITGTPIENRLIDLYSIVQFIDPNYLSPLWEFSYQHCYFDQTNKTKITGYYNLQQLNERLKPILIRREKRKVLKDLPNITEITVPITLHEEQQSYHASFAKGIASILRKKFISPYDQQKLMLLMANMRMVCDSTYLIDKESYTSPKLKELKDILTEKLDLPNKENKVIIFSEWVTMLNLIGKMLHECGIGFAQLSGKVALKNRDKLVKKFETDPHCKVFLSTEAGGSGLNLQVADTVINFELPWNPAKKNQRIGRIDRLGQLSKNLTVINFISRNSIETSIASGLGLKQNLFDGVLTADSNALDTVDFSASGKAQFLQQLETIMEGFIQPEAQPQEAQQETTAPETLQAMVEEAPADSITAENAIVQEGGAQQHEALEKVMNHGMEFLAGLFKMSTGRYLEVDNRKIEVNRQTGEVVMRFKLPKM